MATDEQRTHSKTGDVSDCPFHRGGSGDRSFLGRLLDFFSSSSDRASPGPSGPSAEAAASDGPPPEGDDESLKMVFHTQYDDLKDDETAPRRPEKPDWWKQTDLNPSDISPEEFEEKHSTSDPLLTLRACPSFQSMLSRGFVVPFWSDFEITVHDDGRIDGSVSDERFGVSTHDELQLGEMAGFLEDRGFAPHSIKFNCPWTVNTEGGVATRLTDPAFAVGRPFRIVEGIVNTGYLPHMQINTFFRLPEESESVTHVFKRGDPFFRVVPFVRRSMEKDVRVRDDEFWDTYDRAFPRTVTRFRHALEYRELDPQDATHGETEPLHEINW